MCKQQLIVDDLLYKCVCVYVQTCEIVVAVSLLYQTIGCKVIEYNVMYM